MAAFDQQLVRRADGLSLLFDPAFGVNPEAEAHDPGYIAGYPPGLRENGGQYSHAAMWAILAWARLGDGDRAAELFALLNPINHALTRKTVQQYKTEPYVVAADVYSIAPHIGRGGWSWYTGSAAWMHRAAIEGILGITREGNRLRIAPAIPKDWPGFSARLKVADTICDIRVEQTDQTISRLDGQVIAPATVAYLPLDGVPHKLFLALDRDRTKTPVG
jgi:cyclic beta-1,2-glucan synthetase